MTRIQEKIKNNKRIEDRSPKKYCRICYDYEIVVENVPDLTEAVKEKNAKHLARRRLDLMIFKEEMENAQR